MSQKQLDDAVKKLVQLGYTKSKSQKAMKECGNNFAKAKTWLEKTKEEEDRKAHEVELAAKAKAHAEKQKKEQQDRREREALMDQNPGDDVTEKTRRHPCVAQYGSCRYGASCMFKELPWDTCINYVLGTCLYGDQCRNRHAINGQDIRKMMYGNRDTEHEYIRLENGNYVQVNRQGKVQEGELWVPEYTPEVIAAPIPEPSAFAGGEGSVPTYSEPLHHLQQQQQQQHMFQQHHHAAGGVGGVTLADDLWGSAAASSNNMPKSPGAAAANGDSGVLGYTLRPNAVNTPQGSPNAPTPFLQKARIGQHVAQPALKPVTPMSMMPTPPPPDPRGPAGRAHPCLVQMGECRFGSKCMHADYRGDVCVHWLNGRCKFASDECRFYHEHIAFGGQPSSPHHPSSRNTTGGSVVAAGGNMSFGSVPGAGGSATTPPASPQIAGGGNAAMYDPIWGGPVTAFGSNAVGPGTLAHHHHHHHHGGGAGSGSGGSGKEGSDDAWARAFDPPTREETGRRTGEFVAAQLQLDVALHESRGASAPNPGKWRGPPAAVMAAANAKKVAAPPPKADSTEEARAFEALIEVFPDVDPSLILQALRKCGNDRELVAQAITDATPEKVEQSLQAAIDESFNTSRSVILVTLHSLLPAMEPASLEKILNDANGDFGEAYRVAALTTENLVASDANNQWGTGQTKDGATGRTTQYAPADNLKLERLYGMYKDLERFVVEKAFDRANHNTTETVSILNGLSRDFKLVTRETREEWGNRAITKVIGEAAKQQQQQQHNTNNNVKPGGAAATKNATRGGGKAAKPAADDLNSFTVTSCGDDGEATGADDACAAAAATRNQLYLDTKDEAAEHSDWRRTRQEAYMVNAARAQVVAHAVQAYARQQHDVGKQLLRKSQELKRRYERLNMLAMHALEAERTAQHGVTILDLHGFHVAEALEVLRRRVERCTREGCGALTVVTGKGNHSKHGKSVLRPAVIAWAEERTDVKVREVSPAEIELGIVAPRRRR